MPDPSPRRATHGCAPTILEVGSFLDMDLDSVADELYGLRPSEFISTRTIRALEAKQAGDRQLSTSIAGLKRPTKSAWLVNVLSRQCHEQLNELLGLGADMWAAQDRLAGTELRDIARRRLEVVSALIQKARQIAREISEPVSDETARELGSTLEAAFADPGARDAVRFGRLTTALNYSGFGEIDQHKDPQQRPRVVDKSQKAEQRITGAGHGERANIAQERRRAQSALTEARADVVRTSQEMGRREQEVARAKKEKARLYQQIADLDAELSRLKVEASRATDEFIAAQQLCDGAQSTVRAAEVRVIRARQELDDLES